MTGLDFSPELLALARDTVPKARFIEQDLSDLTSLSDASFEGVWANASLHHLCKEKFPQILRELHRLLSPSGALFLSVKKGSGEGLEADKRYGGILKYWAYYTEEEIAALLEQAGFRTLHIHTDAISNPYQTHSFIKVLALKPDPS